MQAPIYDFLYAPCDTEGVIELKIHMALMRRQGLASFDQNTRSQGNYTLDPAADVILVFGSEDLFQDSQTKAGLYKALDSRERAGTPRVVPVVLRKVRNQPPILGDLVGVPRSGTLEGYSDRDEAWVEVVRGLRQLSELLLKTARP
jgi:hypothetical protein